MLKTITKEQIEQIATILGVAQDATGFSLEVDYAKPYVAVTQGTVYQITPLDAEIVSLVE